MCMWRCFLVVASLLAGTAGNIVLWPGVSHPPTAPTPLPGPDRRAFVLPALRWKLGAWTTQNGLSVRCSTRMLPAMLSRTDVRCAPLLLRAKPTALQALHGQTSSIFSRKDSDTESASLEFEGNLAKVPAGQNPTKKAAAKKAAKASKKHEAPVSTIHGGMVKTADVTTSPDPDKGSEMKVDAMTDEMLLEEFAVKALMLLREAGGGLESTKFQRRWKCTFPSDDIKRYMRGRRLSVAKLLEMCGGTFAVQEVEGSRTKKLFTIADGTDAIVAGRELENDAAVLMHVQGETPESAGASKVALLRAADMGNLELNWTATLPITLDKESNAALDGVLRVEHEEDMHISLDDSFSLQAFAPRTIAADLDSEDGSVAPMQNGLEGMEAAAAAVDILEGTGASAGMLAVAASFEEYSVLPDQDDNDAAFWSGQAVMLGQGREWNLEDDGKIRKPGGDGAQPDGGCSEISCELPVGDAVCAQNVESGLELLRSFKKMGITFGNVLSYNALLDMCALAANQHTSTFANYALSVLETMGDNKVRANAATYSAVMRSCCQSREGLFKAVGVLQDMRKAGFEPARHDYLLLLDACLKEAQRGNGIAVEQGLVVLETMCKAQVPPDVNRCLAMISVIPQDGAWCTFCRDKVVELMRESGVDKHEVEAAMRLASRFQSKA